MIIYGASGHGKVVFDTLEECNTDGITIWDDADKEPLAGHTITQPATDLLSTEKLIITIGRNVTRKKISERLGNQATYGTAIHPCACISKRATIGEGTVVMANATINTESVIGRHCIVNTSASIDHNCILHDFVHVSPNATLSGNVEVGEGTHIGSGACVIPNVKIGRWCTIGLGAVVIRDVPDFATVIGNPGKVIKFTKSEDIFS